MVELFLIFSADANLNLFSCFHYIRKSLKKMFWKSFPFLHSFIQVYHHFDVFYNKESNPWVFLVYWWMFAFSWKVIKNSQLQVYLHMVNMLQQYFPVKANYLKKKPTELLRHQTFQISLRFIKLLENGIFLLRVWYKHWRITPPYTGNYL